MKLFRHQTADGFVYYEASMSHGSVLAFRITDLVNQLFKIYCIDLRAFLYNKNQNN